MLKQECKLMLSLTFLWCRRPFTSAAAGDIAFVLCPPVLLLLPQPGSLATATATAGVVALVLCPQVLLLLPGPGSSGTSLSGGGSLVFACCGSRIGCLGQDYLHLSVDCCGDTRSQRLFCFAPCGRALVAYSLCPGLLCWPLFYKISSGTDNLGRCAIHICIPLEQSCV